jgi:phage-related protein
MRITKQDRLLMYIGSSKKDSEKLPEDVGEVFLTALKMALKGETHEDAKPFKYHGSGVFEVVKDHRGEAFREIYTVRYEEVVFVIHIFQKKSKKKAETPKKDVELIEQRLKWADQIYKEQYGKKKKKG